MQKSVHVKLSVWFGATYLCTNKVQTFKLIVISGRWEVDESKKWIYMANISRNRNQNGEKLIKTSCWDL